MKKITEAKNVIIGAGLTGLSAAFHMKEGEYLLLEKEDRAGGVCRSEKQGGFTYDYTGHLLHIKNEYVRNLIFKMLSGNLVSRERNAVIFSNGVFTRYPFQANLYGLPDRVIDECIRGLVEAKLKNFRGNGETDGKPGPFRDWCLKTFGEGISKYFMIPYNEKLWQTDTRELTTGWMGRYVPRPSLEEVVRGAYNDNKKLFGYNAKFYYPMRGGIQPLIDGMTEKVKNFSTSIAINSIDIRKKIVSADTGDYRYENLISTIPLPALTSLIKNLPTEVKNASRKLKWTSVLNINIGVNRGEKSGRHWVYFPEKKYNFYRAGFYNNFSKYLCPEGAFSMYIEVAYTGGKINKRSTLNQALSGLKDAGILKKNDKIISECLLDIPCAYVIYDKNKETAFAAIDKYLKKHSVDTIGRYGGWKYSTMEDAILDGRDIAESLREK